MKDIHKTRFVIGFFDTLLVIVSFCLSVIIKPRFTFHQVDMFYLSSLLVFLFIWIITSHFSRKFRLGTIRSLREILSSILISNFIILSVVSVLLILFIHLQYSRIIIFGTIGIATVLELIMGFVYYGILQSEFLTEWIGPELINGNRHNGNGNNGNNHHSIPPDATPLKQVGINKSSDKKNFKIIYKAKVMP